MQRELEEARKEEMEAYREYLSRRTAHTKASREFTEAQNRWLLARQNLRGLQVELVTSI